MNSKKFSPTPSCYEEGAKMFCIMYFSFKVATSLKTKNKKNQLFPYKNVFLLHGSNQFRMGCKMISDVMMLVYIPPR